MSSPNSWLKPRMKDREYGVSDYLRQSMGLVDGGVLTIGSNKNVIHSGSPGGKADFFVTGFYDSTTFIDSLTVELGLFIDYVLDYTNATSVTLVGHSMGGIISRNYVVNNPEKNNVETVINIASPNGGSYLANVFYGAHLFAGDRQEDLKDLERQIMATLGLHFDFLAVSDLIDSGPESFITRLNRREHPKHINYFSILANEPILAGIGSLLLSFGLDLPGSENGDWVVSLENQNLENVDYLKTNRPRVLGSYMVTPANHFSIVDKHEVIGEVIESFIDRVY